MDKGARINIRLDSWTAKQIDRIVEMTGESKSVIARTIFLQFLTKNVNNVNDIHRSVNKSKKRKEILLRVDDAMRDRLKQRARNESKSVSRLVRDILCNSIYSVEPEGRYEDTYKERERTETPVDNRLVRFIEGSYSMLRKRIIQDSKLKEDVFHDTTILFVKDIEAKKLRSKGQLIAHFMKRYNMLIYRDTMTKRDRKEVQYADYQQAKEDSTTE